jgi:tripartite-type tricarboxylate transporter receptor subunit TctC
MDRRNFIAASLALPFAVAPRLARAETAPLTKIIFPFAAGGGGDTLCRVLAQRMSQLLDRTIIVENRTGGDGLIGIRAAKGAKADGTTVLVNSLDASTRCFKPTWAVSALAPVRANLRE